MVNARKVNTSNREKPPVGRGYFHLFFHLSVLGCFVMLIGCSRLPSYTEPRVEATEGALPPQAISYRLLTLDDFRSPSLPQYLHGYDHKLNAHSAVALYTNPVDVQFLAKKQEIGDRSLCGTLTQPIFASAMLPEKSWWNKEMADEMRGYVLQHEQIHFAIMEVEARRQNRLMPPEGIRFCGKSHVEVQEGLAEKLKERLTDARKAVLIRHKKFDEDTSNRYAPRVQQQWYEKITVELQNP